MGVRVTLLAKPVLRVTEPSTALLLVSKSWITSPAARALLAKLTPLRSMLKPGRSTRVRLSVLLVPLSCALARSGAPGAPGTRVSTRRASASTPLMAALVAVLP